jgi:cytoskeletal protein RodZ
MNTNSEIAIVVTYFLGLFAGILFAQMMGRFHLALPERPKLITYGYDQTASDSEEEEQEQEQEQEQEETRPGKQSPPPESEFTMTENPMLRHREVHQEESVTQSVMLTELSQPATDS